MVTATTATDKLNEAQRVLLGRVQQLRASEAERSRREVNRVREAVRDALAENVPVSVLMATLDVTKARVYQMRDEANAYTGPASSDA